MMKYSFDDIVPRRGTNSIKWDASPFDDILPMWVADMDFKAAPPILEALQQRVAHGIFGYTSTPQQFNEAIVNWWRKRHQLTLHQDAIIPVAGTIIALSASLEALTVAGDKIIVQSPVYNHFYTSVKNAHRDVVENRLIYKKGRYTIDFDDFERKAADPKVKLFLLCNPHNPVGRVWTSEELLRLSTLCLKHNIIVISDEIHSDLVYSGHLHVPFSSLHPGLGSNSITIASPSKSFNLAGLQVGYLFTENPSYRSSIAKILAEREMELLNPLAIEALIAAYDRSAQWLDELVIYLQQNYTFLKKYTAQHLPQIVVVPLEATYLVWLDCSSLQIDSDALSQTLLNTGRLWVNPGIMYGNDGEGFLRINIACPSVLLQEGLERLKVVVDGL